MLKLTLTFREKIRDGSHPDVLNVDPVLSRLGSRHEAKEDVLHGVVGPGVQGQGRASMGKVLVHRVAEVAVNLLCLNGINNVRLRPE